MVSEKFQKILNFKNSMFPKKLFLNDKCGINKLKG